MCSEPLRVSQPCFPPPSPQAAGARARLRQPPRSLGLGSLGLNTDILMNNDDIRVIESDGIFSIATAEEQIQISDELAAALTGRNQAEICGILRRASEITAEKRPIIEAWCSTKRAR